MRDLLLFLIVFGSLPICFLRPQFGLLLWAWLGYMNPHRLAWTYAYDFRFVYISAIVTLLGLVLAKGVKREFPVNAATTFIILWTCWFTVSTLLGTHPHRSMPEWDRSIKIMVMVFSVLLLHGERRWLHWSAWVIVISIGFWGIKGGLFTLMTGGHYRVYGPHGTFFRDNNTLALAMIVSFPLIRYLQLQAKAWLIRWGLWGLMGIMLASIAGTYSRGGFVGITAVLLVFWLKSRRRLFLGVMMAISIPFLVQWMPPEWTERMESILTYEEDKSVKGRFNSWQFAINVVQDRPVFGAGFQAFSTANFNRWLPGVWRHDAHSIYFEVLAEQGIGGIMVYFLMYFLAFRSGSWVTRHTRGREELTWARDLAAMLQVSLFGYAVTGTFLGMAYFDLPLHLAAMLILTREIVRKTLEEEVLTAKATRQRAPVHSIFGDPGGGGQRGAAAPEKPGDLVPVAVPGPDQPLPVPDTAGEEPRRSVFGMVSDPQIRRPPPRTSILARDRWGGRN